MVNDPRPLDVFRKAALRCLRDLKAHEAGSRLGVDPEHAHQARVAIRRLRTLLKLFAPALPPNFVERWSPAWRELAQSLGRVRNWDVVLAQTLGPLGQAFPLAPDPAELLRQSRKQRSLSQRALRKTLNSPAYAHLLGGFSAELLTLNSIDNSPRQRPFAAQRLARRHRRVRQLCESLSVTCADAQALHELRIAVKTLRYALEFLAPPRASRRTPRHIEALARLQDHLGQLNDLATANALLTPLAPPGLVHGWLAGRTHLLTQTLPPLLADFLAQPAPRI